MADMRHSFVNTALIDKTIESIKKRPFDMRCWQMCICGHMLRIEGATPDEVCSSQALSAWGASKLGITHEQAIELFQIQMCATAKEAIRVLEILRDKGVVDWNRAKLDVAMTGVELGPIAQAAKRYYEGRANRRLAAAHAEFDRLVAEARALA